jgi:diguanylate cyclase (GGDEF)-like protein
MLRITSKVFSDLAIWMVGLGLMMGIVFPFFTVAMGIPSSLALTPWFFLACISAGIAVGAANIGLARLVVARRLRLLAERMRFVEGNLQQMAEGEELENCAPEDCFIEVDSEDEIGESSLAFNRLVEALAASHQSEAVVREFTKMLASQLELDLLVAEALQQLMQHSAAEAGALLVEADGELKVLASQGIRSTETLAKSDHVRLALRTQQQQRILFPKDMSLEGVLADFRPREVLVEPILYKSVPLGVIVLAGAEDFDEQSLRLLELLRPGLGLAMNNALVHDRLQRLAAIDPLTGIYNRRFGMARLHEEFSRAVRDNTPLGVLMLDIDHFKLVNDTYGHLVGDRVLVHIAKVARSVMREGDILVRYGGEEFLAILPAASKEDGRQVAERLRRLIEETSIKDGNQNIRVTISAGATAFPENSVDGEQDLIQVADEALYTAKETGRNRVVMG